MSGTYSVTAIANSCTSVPATVAVVINQTPAAPSVSNPAVTYCQNAAAVPLPVAATAGNALNWYTTPTGGTPTTTAPTPLTTTAGVTNYYVSQFNTAAPACESGRASVTVTVRTTPTVSGSATDPASCTSSNGTITLTGLTPATAYAVQYSKNSGTPVSATLTSNTGGAIIITGLSSGTYTNITASINGCPSNAAGPFTLVSPSAPATPTAGSSSPLCAGSTLNLTSSAGPAGATYTWTGPNGYTSMMQNPVRTGVSAADSGAYSVTVTFNGCTSAAATVNVVVSRVPATPAVSPTPVSYCQNAAAAPLAVTATPGNTLKWYTVATGGTPVDTAPVPGTATPGTTTYYVSQYNPAAPSCESGRAAITVNVLPSPVISGSAANPANCSAGNGQVTLTGLAPSVTYSVAYTKSGSAPATVMLASDAAGAIVITLPPGTYTNITASLNGCTSNAAGPFTLVSTSAPAAAVAGSNSPLCAGGTLNLTASAIAGATYAWTGPGGFTGMGQNLTRPNATTAMSGTYSVTATVSGCVSAAAAVNVVINPSGTVAAASNTPVCAGSTVTFISTLSAAGSFNYAWSGPNNFSSNQQNPAISNAAQAASGTYTVTATSAQGNCSSSATTVVLVAPKPAVTTAGYADPATCSPTSGVITLQGLSPATAYTVQYSRNGATPVVATITSGADGSVAIINLPGGVYTNISATLGGCMSNPVGPITLVETNATPARPAAKANSPLCVGGTLQLRASVSATGTTAYRWSGPNGFTSSQQNPFVGNVTAAAAGRYYVTAGTGSCVSEKDSVDVLIGDYPVVTLGPDLLLPPGTQQTLTSSVRNGPVSQYLWSPPVNLSCTSCASPVVTVQSNITYVLQVTNSYGCSASDTISIKTLCDNSNVFVPDAFTPDGDGLNDKFMIRASGSVRVKYFRVFNKWGEMVFERLNFLPNDPAYGWDGRVKGVLGPPDVYVYTALVTCEGGASFPFKGNVSVLK